LTSVEFANNSAAKYGVDKATYFKEARIIEMKLSSNPLGQRPTHLTLYSGDAIEFLKVASYDGYNQSLSAEFGDELFGMIVLTQNGVPDLANSITFGGTRSLIIDDTIFFRNVRILAVTSPPELLNSTKNESIPDLTAYNLSVVRVNNRGALTAVWDSFPIGIKRCSEKESMQQVQAEGDPFPRCTPSKSLFFNRHYGVALLTHLFSTPVICASGCISGQGHCYETNKCTCTEGFEGQSCQLVTGLLFSTSCKG
jgi:hypothetical protein